LFLQNNGAENDGLYARFLRSKLDEQGYRDTAVIAPLWERLIKEKAASNTMFATSLAGDILLCAPTAKRAYLLKEMQTAFTSGIPTRGRSTLREIWVLVYTGSKPLRLDLANFL
jgi:hypothetical protein